MPLPPGVPGELLIGGLTLAKGYRKAPTETKRSFIELDWLPGERLYRSGDVAQWMTNGDLLFLGRKDNQVKILGYRVSLDWIELNIRQLDIIEDVCVCLETNLQNDTEVVAYYTLGPKQNQITQSNFRNAIKTELPSAIIPNRFIQVDELPLTINGKIDRVALSKFYSVQKNNKISYPMNESETNMLKIWKETLHLDKIGMDDNFFELGGHSIKAILLASKLRKLLGIEVALQLIFEFPTPRSLTQALNQKSTERNLPADLLQLRLGSGNAKRITFFMPTVVGTSMTFSPLTRVLKGDPWCFGLQCPGFTEGTTKLSSLLELSLHFCKSIMLCANGKPVNVVGWSFGAHLAYETAKHLESSGIETRVILIDAAVDGIKRSRFLQEDDNAKNSSKFLIDMEDLALIKTLSKQDSERIIELTEHHYQLFIHHTTKDMIKSDLIVIEAMHDVIHADMKNFEIFTSGSFRFYSTPGNHFSIFDRENLLNLGDILSSELH
jgi:thioesterase domain-containing protein/acyl carrier protein